MAAERRLAIAETAAALTSWATPGNPSYFDLKK
jgi:hypothetical protein